MKQKQKLTLRQLNILLTGLFFAAYAAYNVFIIIRDLSALPPQGILISAIVALLFTILAAFVWTAGVKMKNKRFLVIRRITFIITFLAVFALKVRMVDQVVAYFDSEKPETILYGISYFTTVAAILILLVYYIFFLTRRPFYPRASIVLPTIAMILFLCSFIFEIILFFAFDFRLEANLLRTVVIRPVFYLGFIGLCVYFLYPPQSRKAR